MWLFYVMGAILAVGGMWLAFNLVRGLWAVATGKGDVQSLNEKEMEDEADELVEDPIYEGFAVNLWTED